jgi:hypothetical protein
MSSKNLTANIKEVEGTSPDTTRWINPSASHAAERKNKSPGRVGTVGTCRTALLKDTWSTRNEEGSIGAAMIGY